MRRERLTITLDQELLTAVDATIDGSAIRNRSHAIEDAIRHGLALHQLTTAVVTGESTDLLPVLQASGIHQVFVIGAEVALPGLTVRTLPSEFGDATALSLVANELNHPFVIIQATNCLPESFLPAYVSHTKSKHLLTHILTTTGTTFVPTGCSIADPAILQALPAGTASLEALFAHLAKAGKVGAYVS